MMLTKRIAGSLVAIATILASANSVAQAQETTIAQPISTFIYDANANYTFVTGGAAWGAPTCAMAQYAQVTNTVAGSKQLLVILFGAKISGKRVMFRGACDTNPNIFNINYVTVLD